MFFHVFQSKVACFGSSNSEPRMQSRQIKVFSLGIPDPEKMFHVILVGTSQQPGWGVDLRYVGCITSSGRGFDIAFVGGDEFAFFYHLILILNQGKITESYVEVGCIKSYWSIKEA